MPQRKAVKQRKPANKGFDWMLVSIQLIAMQKTWALYVGGRI